MANAVERLENAGADFSNWTPQDTNERRSSYGWDQYGTDDEGRQERGLPPYRAHQPAWPDADLGPLIGRKRGFKTRERVPLSGGLGGMEEVNEEADAKKRGKRAEEGDVLMGRRLLSLQCRRRRRRVLSLRCLLCPLTERIAGKVRGKGVRWTTTWKCGMEMV